MMLCCDTTGATVTAMEENLILVATIVKRNGAYLVSWDHHASMAEDMTPNQLYDAASSRVKAREIARRGAVEMGIFDMRWAKDQEKHGPWDDELLGKEEEEQY
jgi:hypothetical protein